MFYSKERVEFAKAIYSKGTRIELISLCNDERDMPRGLRGTVVGVDDQPSLLMEWDNSRTLSIFPGEDTFRKLTPKEIEEENQTAEEKEDMGSSPTLGM
jgi:hypothetical protein